MSAGGGPCPKASEPPSCPGLHLTVYGTWDQLPASLWDPWVSRGRGAELSPPAQGDDEGYGIRHLPSPCWFARWLQGTEGALRTRGNCTHMLFSPACGLGLPLGRASSTG